jgi:hypothetical protein
MISLQHKVVFIHIPKCAGQSIEETFLKDIGLDWENHRYLFGCFQKPQEWSNILPNRLAHISAMELKDFNLLPLDQLQKFYKFAIVREPIDRLISTWKYLSPEQEFDKWIRETVNPLHEKKDYFFKDQADFIFDNNEALLIDEIISFSKLHLRPQEFMKYLFHNTPLAHRNVGEKKLLNITSATESLIKNLYMRDYDLLNKYFI